MRRRAWRGVVLLIRIITSQSIHSAFGSSTHRSVRGGAHCGHVWTIAAGGAQVDGAVPAHGAEIPTAEPFAGQGRHGSGTSATASVQPWCGARFFPYWFDVAAQECANGWRATVEPGRLTGGAQRGRSPSCADYTEGHGSCASRGRQADSAGRAAATGHRIGHRCRIGGGGGSTSQDALPEVNLAERRASLVLRLQRSVPTLLRGHPVPYGEQQGSVPDGRRGAPMLCCGACELPAAALGPSPRDRQRGDEAAAIECLGLPAPLAQCSGRPVVPVQVDLYHNLEGRRTPLVLRRPLAQCLGPSGVTTVAEVFSAAFIRPFANELSRKESDCQKTIDQTVTSVYLPSILSVHGMGNHSGSCTGLSEHLRSICTAFEMWAGRDERADGTNGADGAQR